MEISDETLYSMCRRYGENARIWRQKFLGLLPEVFKRKLYAKKGFSSVYEFAFKLAGVSEEQVSRVLNLERKFCDKPDLHRALVNGEISINKLARVASIANADNQSFISEQAKILPKNALEVFIRDYRQSDSSLQNPISGGQFVPGHKLETQINLLQDSRSQISTLLGPKLSDETKRELNELQQKGIDIDELILNAITSRHIPVKIKNLLRQEYGTKCSVPNCQRESEHIHHEIPFAIAKNHNPFLLKPLCREHHIIAHSINYSFQKHLVPSAFSILAKCPPQRVY